MINETATTTSPCLVGSPAPRFSLKAVRPNLPAKVLDTDQFRGRWLALLFYPRDFSFVCPTELTAFSAKITAFQQRNCDLLAVSIDSLETHQQWLSTSNSDGGVQGLQFPLGSDPEGITCRTYGVFREEDGLPNRGLFLIDPKGILRYSVVHDLSVGRNAEDVLRVLDGLTSGGLCPANWTRADGVLDIESMLKPGRVLGHYRIERELGRGTFGCVLAAQDLRLHRQVALKVIRKTTTESESNLLNEARSAAAVNHPNVCTIYAVEEIDGLPTIVMEYLDGIPLDRYIANGFGDSTFKTIARGLASGLAAAHKAGIIHGDLKPANVILRNSSEPVILDFGLARLLQQHPTSAPPDSNQREASSPAEQSAIESTDVWQVDPAQIWISQDPSGSASTADYEVGPKAEDRSAPNPYGKISGTPAYMSPEQARGAILSEATDIFSLGQIFAEMLTGVRPLDKMGPLQIFQTLQKPEFVSSIAKNLPAEYQELVASMLTIEPANRPTAQEVAQKL